VGAASFRGHSAINQQASCGMAPALVRWAWRTRQTAKRLDMGPLEPCRHVTFRKALGRLAAHCPTLSVMVAHRFVMQSHVVGAGIGSQRGRAHVGRFIPGERAEQPADPDRIAAHAIHAGDVGTANLLDTAERRAGRVLSWPSRARAGVSVRLATAAEWRRQLRISWAASFLRCRCGSGLSPCRSGCAASSLTGPTRSRPSRGSSSKRSNDCFVLRRARPVPATGRA
jgi:hypothetical protein